MSLAAVSSLAGAARSFYRRLPADVRRRAQPLWTPFWTFMLGAAMPNADPMLRRPTRAAAVVGLMRAASGLGAAARLLGLELSQSGFPVRSVDVTEMHGLPLDLPIEAALAGAPQDGEAVIFHLNPPSMLRVAPWLEPAVFKGKRLIGYWTWELERAPLYWRNAARKVHEIWAPSRFAADAISRTVPDAIVRVAPHPVAAAVPNPAQNADRARVRRQLAAGDLDFVALTAFAMGSCMERKNPLAAVAAFERAFAGRTNALLIVRMREAAAYPDGAARLREAAARSKAQVRVIEADAGGPTLPELYAACDAYLSLHRSEGFGLPIAEAALAGRPVVATAWSANLEFQPRGYQGLVPAELVTVRDPQSIYRASDCLWADPCLDAAAEKLAALADDADLRRAWAEEGRSYAQARLGGGAAGRLLRMEDVRGAPAVRSVAAPSRCAN